MQNELTMLLKNDVSVLFIQEIIQEIMTPPKKAIHCFYNANTFSTIFL